MLLCIINDFDKKKRRKCVSVFCRAAAKIETFVLCRFDLRRSLDTMYALLILYKCMGKNQTEYGMRKKNNHNKKQAFLLFFYF